MTGPSAREVSSYPKFPAVRPRSFQKTYNTLRRRSGVSETDSSSRFATDRISASTVVTLTASVFGVVAAYVTEAWTGGSGLAFGALLGVGMGVPTLYQEWDVRSTKRAAFGWAVVGSGIAYGFYVVVFVLSTRLGADDALSDGLAGGATIALGIAFSLYCGRVGS
jgi:hypothetical protein